MIQIKSPNSYSLLWLGGIFDEETMLASRAVSPAANRWQLGLLNALQNQYVNIGVFGHLPEPLWPKGKIYVSQNSGRLASNFSGNLASYWNIPGIRRSFLQLQYRRGIRSTLSLKDKPFIVSYNAAPHVAWSALWAQEKYDIPWICVIADAPYDAEKNLIKHDPAIHQAAGRIFLSWQSYEECNRAPKLHLDGGVERIKFNVNNLTYAAADKPIILYTGALSTRAGINLLVDAFELVKHPHAELWICGQGHNSYVERMASQSSRIKFFGLVSEADIQEMYKNATILVNPRPTKALDYNANFPSKVLEYLSYGKPVISTWTNGLCPEYRQVLVILEEETKEGLADAIDSTLSYNSKMLVEWGDRIKTFLEETRLWQRQAEKLTDWLLTSVMN